MKGLIVAIQFLTHLPTPRLAVSREEFAASMRWFPAVGLIVGAAVALGAWTGALLDPWVGAVLAVLAWVAVTGALHLDGLGDVADAVGAAHKDRDRVLAVLADPHVGSFGVVAIAVQLATKLVLLHALVDVHRYVAIALIPFAARIGPLAWSRWLPDLHAGLGSRFRRAAGPATLMLWTALLAAAAWWSWGLVATPILVLGWGLWLGKRLGGISGDGHGGGIEIVESGLLLTTLIATRLA